jgi:uncharacterized membrane protein YdjX (TVP38/TMEM64 family)
VSPETHPPSTPNPWRLRTLVALLLVLLLLALAWQFSPAAQWLNPEALFKAAQHLAWGVQLGFIVLAACLAVPFSLLVLLAVLVQGPWLGAGTSLLAGALAGALSFGAGALLGRQAVAQIAGPQLQAVNALVARRGFLAVFVVRLVPVAPFALVNLMLGATAIRWAPFLLGNLLGMLPMVGITAWAAPQILAQLQNPGGSGLLMLGAVLAVVAGLTVALKRWARKQ